VPTAPLRAALLAALLGACPAADAADDLGVLFHTPEERARFDKLRRGEPSESVGAVGPVAAKAEVTGFVRRSDGRNTVWINGIAVTVAGTRGDTLLDPRAVRNPGDSVKVERGKAAEVKR
jgi:hypothetical protein